MSLFVAVRQHYAAQSRWGASGREDSGTAPTGCTYRCETTSNPDQDAVLSELAGEILLH